MTFTESDLTFNFNKEWVVHRFDTHIYYQGLSGVGLKGVDFIGIWKNKTLVFFEIKNYRKRFLQQKIVPIRSIQKSPENLAKTIAQKMEDTILAIEVIHKYFLRKWWYRVLRPLLFQFPILPFEWTFWSKAYQLIKKPDSCFAVLWIELEEKDTDLIQILQHSLEKYLKESALKVQVTHQNQNPFQDSLVVQKGLIL